MISLLSAPIKAATDSLAFSNAFLAWAPESWSEVGLPTLESKYGSMASTTRLSTGAPEALSKYTLFNLSHLFKTTLFRQLPVPGR